MYGIRSVSAKASHFFESGGSDARSGLGRLLHPGPVGQITLIPCTMEFFIVGSISLALTSLPMIIPQLAT